MRPLRPPPRRRLLAREVVAVVEPSDGVLDPDPHRLGDARLGVDHPRHRLDADPREGRDIAHRGASDLVSHGPRTGHEPDNDVTVMSRVVRHPLT